MNASVWSIPLVLSGACWTVACGSERANFAKSNDVAEADASDHTADASMSGSASRDTTEDASTQTQSSSDTKTMDAGGTSSSDDGDETRSGDASRETQGERGTVLGGECTKGEDCETGFCADGYCCDETCDGQCESCAENGSEGSCVAVEGAPRGERDACVGDDPCQGECDGLDGQACAFPGNTTVCEPAACIEGVALSESVCDGAGACSEVDSVTCAGGVCTAEGTGCEGCESAGCGSTQHCDLSGACYDKLADGEACTSVEECSRGNCVDGICCDTLCDGFCESCTESGSEGTCQVRSGDPLPARGECEGEGVCKGACDGENGGACAYPGAATQCGAPSCAAAEATSAAQCDGAGECASAITTTCASGGCEATACAAACTANSCGSGDYCATSGVCEAKKSLGQSCGDGDECLEGNCVDGVCCNSACNGQCEVCSSSGQCGRKSSGAPSGGREACDGAGTLCGGVCDGSSDSCVYPNNTTACSSLTCSADLSDVTFTVCNGAGSCSSNSVDECAGATYCGSGSCINKKSDSNPCSVSAECASGNCAIDSSGICCAAARANCDGTCIDTTSNNDNCGGCGEACGANEACEDSDCACDGFELSCGSCGAWAFEYADDDTEGWLELAPPGAMFSQDVTSVKTVANPNGSGRVLEVTIAGGDASFSVPLCSNGSASVASRTFSANMYIDITSGSFAFDSGVQLYVWNESTSTNTLLNNQLSLGDSAGWQAVQVVLSASTATHVGFRFTVTSEFGAKIYLDNVQFN